MSLQSVPQSVDNAQFYSFTLPSMPQNVDKAQLYTFTLPSIPSHRPMWDALP